MNKLWSDFILVLVVFVVFIAGVAAHMLYVQYQTEKNYKQEVQSTFDGLWFTGNYTWTEAVQHAVSLDDTGNWIAVNIRNMSYERALEICRHEISHEIWASYCENHFEKCINITK